MIRFIRRMTVMRELKSNLKENHQKLQDALADRANCRDPKEMERLEERVTFHQTFYDMAKRNLRTEIKWREHQRWMMWHRLSYRLWRTFRKVFTH